MSRISCNVTKDLLSSYLDEVCSAESRELVEEHLRECPSCRKFLSGMREQDLGKDVVRIDFMKKIRRFVDIQSLLGIFVPLFLLLGGFYGANRDGVTGEKFYYIEMPVLMLLCAYALGGGRGRCLPEGREWLAPIFGLVLAGAAAAAGYGALYLMAGWDRGEPVLQIQPERMGPLMHLGCLTLALGAVALLAVLALWAKRKGRVFTVSTNLAWLALNLALTLDASFYKMTDIVQMRQYWNGNVLVLGAEFVLITVLMFVFRKAGFMKRGEPV